MEDSMSLFLEALAKYLAGAFLVSLFVFVPAGDISFINGWIFISAMFIPILIIGCCLLLKSPELLRKRLNGTEVNQKQNAIVKASGLVFVISFVISGIDHRFLWSKMPLSISIASAIILLFSYILYWMVLRVNDFLSRTIEIQNKHQVVDTGPYSIVRHPMYLATTIMFLAIPLTLGSLLGFSVMLAYIPLIVRRIKLEEEFLVSNLPGYIQYRDKVKYRLVPFIW